MLSVTIKEGSRINEKELARTAVAQLSADTLTFFSSPPRPEHFKDSSSVYLFILGIFIYVFSC
jgi:hypothetical protein